MTDDLSIRGMFHVLDERTKRIEQHVAQTNGHVAHALTDIAEIKERHAIEDDRIEQRGKSWRRVVVFLGSFGAVFGGVLAAYATKVLG